MEHARGLRFHFGGHRTVVSTGAFSIHAVGRVPWSPPAFPYTFVITKSLPTPGPWEGGVPRYLRAGQRWEGTSDGPHKVLREGEHPDHGRPEATDEGSELTARLKAVLPFTSPDCHVGRGGAGGTCSKAQTTERLKARSGFFSGRQPSPALPDHPTSELQDWDGNQPQVGRAGSYVPFGYLLCRDRLVIRTLLLQLPQVGYRFLKLFLEQSWVKRVDEIWQLFMRHLGEILAPRDCQNSARRHAEGGVCGDERGPEPLAGLLLSFLCCGR